MSEGPKNKRLSHEALNSAMAAAGLLLAILSLGMQLKDRLDEDRERVDVQPMVGHTEVAVGIVNIGHKDIWLRAVRIEFLDAHGNDLRSGAIQVKPPPEGAMRMVPKQVEVFTAPFSHDQVPESAVCAQVIVATTVSFLTDYRVTADLFRLPSNEKKLACD
jgi:hypothetical protein